MNHREKRKLQRRQDFILRNGMLLNNTQSSTTPTSPSQEKGDEGGVMFYLSTEVAHKKDDKGLVTLSFNGYNGGSVNLTDYGIPYPMYYNIDGIQNNSQIPILHEHYTPIGHTTSIVKNSSSLNGTGVASYPSESRKIVVEALDNGFPFQASMGLRVMNSADVSFLKEGIQRTVNNRTITGPAYVAEKSKLREMTVTMSGRDDSTNFNLLNQEAITMLLNATPKDTTPGSTPPANPLEHITNKDGAPVVPPVVPPTTPVLPPVTTPSVVNNSQPLLPQVPATGSVLIQTFALSKLLSKYPEHEELIENSLKAGRDLQTIENEIKLSNYENGFAPPPKIKQGAKNERSDMIVAHFALSCGVKPETIEKHGISKKAVELADASPHWGFVESMVNIANSHEGSNQRRWSGFSDIELMCKSLRRINREAVELDGLDVNNNAYSVVDMPNLMRKVTTMQLEERWTLSPPFSLKMLEERSNNDFRKTEAYRPGGGELWNQVPKSGKLELTHFGTETRYTTELDTYGQMAAFDRQDIYNDNMGVISSMLKAMVEGALYIPDIKLGKKMLNQAAAAATFWVDTENSRTGIALSRANLSTVWQYVRKYNDNRGKNIVQMIDDRWTLITGPTLEETAWDIIKQDRIVNDTTANTKTGDKNFWFNKFDLAMFPQMGNTSLLGSGTFVNDNTYVLWPSSKQFSPYVITYLRGMKKPTIQLVDLPENMLGYGVRGFWDVEVNERERQAILRAKN